LIEQNPVAVSEVLQEISDEGVVNDDLQLVVALLYLLSRPLRHVLAKDLQGCIQANFLCSRR
jgi:hypothetical protein